MEDIIDIIVTETTNTIEITSQATDEIIDVNIIDNREDITLNVTPSLVEININSLTGNFGVEWGEITGTLADQTDLNTALGLKANLVGGKVPASELPSYVDDVVEVANFAALPATGETGKIYITLDNNKIYRWSGSVYVEIADSAAVWGAITGTLSSQTDLQSALDAKLSVTTAASTYVPYTGATTSVNLGTHDLTSRYLVANGGSALGGVVSIKQDATYLAKGNGYSSIASSDVMFDFFGYTGASTYKNFSLRFDGLTDNTLRTYTLPDASGTLALTGNLAAYVPYTGATANVDLGTHTLLAAKGTFSSSGSSDTVGITHSSGSGIALNISKAGNGEGIYVNKSSGSGNAVTIVGTLNATTLVKNGGTSAEFLKADGSVDSSTYVDTSTNQSIAGIKTFTTSVHAAGLRFSESGGFANVSGYTQIGGTADYFNFVNGVNSKQATFNYGTGGSGYTYTLPNSNGTLALTSQLSSYLPLSGGTLTGALGGTSATFSANLGVGVSPLYKFHVRTNTNGNIGFRNPTDFNASWTTGSAFGVFNDADNANEKLYLETSQLGLNLTSQANTLIGGNVGIGTTSPGVALQVNVSNSAGLGGQIALHNSSTGAVGSRTELSFLNDSGASGIGTRSGRIISSMDNAGNGASNMQFWTWSGSTDSERMRITSGGNVGIGTTGNASYKLLVSGNNASVDSNGQNTIFLSAGTSVSYIDTSYIGGGSYVPMAFGTGGSERMRITSGGDVLVGKTTTATNESGVQIYKTANTSGRVNIVKTVSGTNSSVANYHNGTYVGGMDYGDTLTTFLTTSDYRLKEDLQTIKGLEIIRKIKVYDYKWKSEDSRMNGVLAHELAEILPYAVSGVKDGERMQGVDYSKIVPVMIQAIKELKAELDTLKNK